MSIVIVRHGETALNRAKILQPLDTPLGETGIAQASALCERLCAAKPHKIVCSDLLRARMTVAPLLDRVSIAVEYWPELRERSFGDLLGRRYAELDEDIFAEGYVPANGESSPQFGARVAAAWARIVRERCALDGTLVVITHNLFCGVLSRNHLQVESPLSVPAWFANTSVTVVDAHAPYRVSRVNCTEHLLPGDEN